MEDNIKIKLQEAGKGKDWIDLVYDREM